jgi:hypothetical protein
MDDGEENICERREKSLRKQKKKNLNLDIYISELVMYKNELDI